MQSLDSILKARKESKGILLVSLKSYALLVPIIFTL